MKRQRKSEPEMTSAERTNVYLTLARLNGAFDIAVQSLGGLSQFLTPRDLKEMLGMTQEIQTEINSLLVERLHDIEMNDWAHFGKIRTAMEKRLRGEK